MKDYLLKAKLKQTLYLDFDGDGWLDDNPKGYCNKYYYKLNEHYTYFKKGSIVYFKKYEDEEFNYIGTTLNSSYSICYETIEEIFNSDWFEILENKTKL